MQDDCCSITDNDDRYPNCWYGFAYEDTKMFSWEYDRETLLETNLEHYHFFGGNQRERGT